MTTHVDLPGGRWAEIREADEVREKDRRSLRRVFMRLTPAARACLEGSDVDFAKLEVVATADDIDVMHDANDMLIAAAVASWSLEQPPGPDVAGDLPAVVYDALYLEALKIAPALIGLNTAPPAPRTDGSNLPPPIDPSSPTPPSAA